MHGVVEFNQLMSYCLEQVVSYLVHYGYSDTASALISESALEGQVIPAKEAESMRLRRSTS